jgi:hypothetical protein
LSGVFDNRLHSEACWLKLEVRKQVETVEVLSVEVESVVAHLYSVWVEHGNNEKVELIENSFGLFAPTDQEIDNTHQTVTGADFAWMNPGCDEYQRFINPFEMFLLSPVRIQMFNEFFFRLIFDIRTSQCYQVNWKL